MKTSKYRAAVALLFLVIVAGGLIFNLGLGTVSSFGFDKIAAICPLGALETFLASKTFVPSVFFAFLFFIVVAVIVGRAFCGWMCPVPLLRSVLGAEEKRISKGYPKGAKESEPDLEGKRADFAVADVQEEKAAFSSAKITDRSIPKGPFYVLFTCLRFSCFLSHLSGGSYIRRYFGCLVLFLHRKCFLDTAFDSCLFVSGNFLSKKMVPSILSDRSSNFSCLDF